MARPLKKVTESMVTRNKSISKDVSKHILKVAYESAAIQARRIPHNWDFTTDDIVSDAITSLLTSDTFDPNLSEDKITRYVRRSVKRKAMSQLRTYMKQLERQLERQKYIK